MLEVLKVTFIGCGIVVIDCFLSVIADRLAEIEQEPAKWRSR